MLRGSRPSGWLEAHLRVRQPEEELALLHQRAVGDEHFFYTAGFERAEHHCAQGRGDRTHDHIVAEHSLLDGGDPKIGFTHPKAARRELPYKGDCYNEHDDASTAENQMVSSALRQGPIQRYAGNVICNADDPWSG